MKPSRILLPAALAGAVGLAACADQASTPLTPRSVASASRSAAAPAALSPSAVVARLDPAPGALKLPGAATDLLRFDGAPGGVIDGSQYQCDDDTPVVEWYLDEFYSAFLPAVSKYFFLAGLAADQIPFYEALLFESPGRDQYFGYHGEYTNVLHRTERDVKSFWDIDASAIRMVPMHGTVFHETAKVAATYQLLFVNDDGTPLSAEQAREIAEAVRDTIDAVPGLDGGNHPWFSFNAVSVGPIPSLHLAPTIVMGDGILEGFDAVGFADVAPQAIYAHEFAHQIQFARGYSASADGVPAGSAPERTRYTELMADAFSAYYLTHARGAALNKHRVAEFLQVFFQIGDCAFTDSGHHGTPNQRMAAAEFGFEVADQAQKQGHILTADEFHALFVARFPQIVAPDAS